MRVARCFVDVVVDADHAVKLGQCGVEFPCVGCADCGVASDGDERFDLAVARSCNFFGEAALFNFAHVFQRETDWHEKLPPA